MTEICVLLRVYNRIEDLVNCVKIIRDTWKSKSYYLIVIFNGREDGYVIPEAVISEIDKLITIDNNTGHFSGNSRLLLAGLTHIPKNCVHTVILEADTWLNSDHLITKYLAKMAEIKAVWASAQFFRYVRNLATDFAIINTEFLRSHPQVFKFDATPEYYVANYLHDHHYRFIYIEELMPINLPKYINHYPFAPTGRFFVFPKGPMVTHHIELLHGGMEEKKYHFNVVSGTEYFESTFGRSLKFTKWLMDISIWASFLIPYKGWIIKKKRS